MNQRPSLLCTTSLAAMLSSGIVSAGMPGEIDQVPLYPGAKAAPVDPYENADPKVAKKEFLVDADLDQVYEFYRKQYPTSIPGKLRGGLDDTGQDTGRHDNGFGDCVRTAKIPAWDESSDGGSLLGGKPTPKWDEFTHYSKAETLALRRKVRGARANDQWRVGANLNWCLRPDARNFTVLNVVLRDESFLYEAGRPISGRPRTHVEIQRRSVGTSGSVAYSGGVESLGSPAHQAMFDQMMDQNPNLDAAARAQLKEERKQALRQLDDARAEMQKHAPPKRQDSDIPVYPGALLDTKATDSMGAMGAATPFRNYLYYSEDDLAKVKAFYQQRADRKAAPQSDSRTIVLRQGPNPGMAELAVTLKPASDAGMKTEIMIRSVTAR